MNVILLAPFATALVGVTAVIILVSRDWRVSISALGAQYGGVLILITYNWPLEYAVVKLIAGWMAAAVLGMGLAERAEGWGDEIGGRVSGTLFRVFLAGLVGLTVYSLIPLAAQWLNRATYAHIMAGLTLIGLGVLHLSLTVQPTRLVLALLTALAGFEVLYATMETSLLVNAILAALTLGLALVGAYFCIVSEMEVQG